MIGDITWYGSVSVVINQMYSCFIFSLTLLLKLYFLSSNISLTTNTITISTILAFLLVTSSHLISYWIDSHVAAFIPYLWLNKSFRQLSTITNLNTKWKCRNDYVNQYMVDKLHYTWNIVNKKYISFSWWKNYRDNGYY